MEAVQSILVVDNEPAVLRIIRLVLERAGFRVLAASSAREALSLAADLADLSALVTDLEMGTRAMNGIDLAWLLRKERPGLAVLVISGSVNGESQAHECGFPFLAKHFTPSLM